MLLNPLVVISVVVVMITAGWLLYTGGTGSIAQARPGANLLPALDPAAAGIAPAASGPSATRPGPWAAGTSAQRDAETSLELVDGQLQRQALELDVTGYAAGDVTLTTPRVDVEPGKTYLFKAFATSDADFTLLARQLPRRRQHRPGAASGTPSSGRATPRSR